MEEGKVEYVFYYIYAFDKETQMWYFVEKCTEDRMKARANAIEYFYGKVKVRRRIVRYEDYYVTPEHPDYVFVKRESGIIERQKRMDQIRENK